MRDAIVQTFDWILGSQLKGGGFGGPSLPAIATIAAPSFNPATLIVGSTLSASYIAGSYTSPGGAVTEGAISWIVGEASVAGSYVLQPGDTIVSATPALLVAGVDYGLFATTGDVDVTNSAPTAGDGTGSGTVVAGTGAAPSAMAAPTVTTTATRITITKAADPFDGGSAITSYSYRTSTDNGATWGAWAALTSPQTVTGFVPGATNILAQTRANNAIGSGATGASSTAATMKVITFLGFHKGDDATVAATYAIDLTAALDTSNGGAGGPLLQGDVGFSLNGWAVSTGDANVDTSGWAELFDTYQSGTRGCNLGLHWKAMGAVPDTSATVNASNSANSGSCCAIAWYRYVDPTTPMDVTPPAAVTLAASAAVDPAAITPVSAGALILVGCGASGDITPASLNTISGMTRRGSITKGGSARGLRVMFCEYAGWTSGAYDPAATGSTESTASDASIGFTTALRPY